MNVLDWGGGAWVHIGEWDIRQFKAVEIGEVIEWGKGVGQGMRDVGELEVCDGGKKRIYGKRQ